MRAAHGNADFGTLCADPKVRDAVLKELNATGKKAGLRPLETLQTVILTEKEWTPQNGCLTAGQSLVSFASTARWSSRLGDWVRGWLVWKGC